MNSAYRKQLFLSLLATLLALPLAAAARSGFSALDNGIELMSNLFYPSVLLTNQNVQIGFFKFLYFIIIFTIVNWVLGKFIFKADDDKNSKRAAGVIAFAFAAISAWFMPENVALGTAGLITAIFNLLIPVGLTVGAVYLAFYKLKESWWQHLLGAFIILAAIWIINWTMTLI
ncbi:hypothetical protein GF367_01690 [Candidatus Woesearchaeota archaeon]|nr:hypothetical protein [Candidatus Woesearchaeota archaeon]